MSIKQRVRKCQKRSARRLYHEVLTAGKISMLIFWDVTPCGLVADSSFLEKQIPYFSPEF
jgi:hypothetical protein